MPRAVMILSLVAFVVFNYGQYRGWSLFSDVADAQAFRSTGGARAFHK